MKTTRSTKIDDISFYFVKQMFIKFVVMLYFRCFRDSFFIQQCNKNEYIASQNDFQNRISSIFSQKWISIVFIDSRFLESTSLKSALKLISSKSKSMFVANFLLFVVVFVVVLIFVFAIISVVFVMIIIVDVFEQHHMSFSTHSKWQTMMTQMKKQSR
jgi:hypothetical protein